MAAPSLKILVVVMAVCLVPSVSGAVAGVVARALLSGTTLLNVEGPSMSLNEIKFILFNIGSTDSAIKEKIEALDKKFDNFAEVAKENFEAIKDGIRAIKLQNAIDFSASGAGDAEQDIQNQIDRFQDILRRREELKALNGSDDQYKSLANRLSTFLQEAHQPLRDSLPKLRRALDGSLASAQASSGGVLCDVARKAEIELQSATPQNYDLEKTLNSGPLLVWRSMLRIQETAIYIYNLSCQQLNETDGFCFSEATTFKAGLTSQRDKLLTCLDPLLIALSEEGRVTACLQTNNLVMGWMDMGREQFPEMQQPDVELAQYVKLEKREKSYTLFIGGSCFVTGDSTKPLFCQRTSTANVIAVAVIPKRTEKGFAYKLLSGMTTALAEGMACFTQQKLLGMAGLSQLDNDGHIWSITEDTGAATGTGRYIDGSTTCAASDLRPSGFALLSLCLTCLQWLLRSC